jgi:hypothetical protein
MFKNSSLSKELAQIYSIINTFIFETLNNECSYSEYQNYVLWYFAVICSDNSVLMNDTVNLFS